MVLQGRYEPVYLVVPLVILAFMFVNHFNIVGMDRDFSKNLGVHYNFVLFMGLSIVAMITASVVVVVGTISYIIFSAMVVTPCLLGMNVLYSLIHTVVVFVAGSTSLLATNSNLAFVVNLVLAVKEVITKENLDEIYNVDFEIMEIEERPLCKIIYGQKELKI